MTWRKQVEEESVKVCLRKEDALCLLMWNAGVDLIVFTLNALQVFCFLEQLCGVVSVVSGGRGGGMFATRSQAHWRVQSWKQLRSFSGIAGSAVCTLPW